MGSADGNRNARMRRLRDARGARCCAGCHRRRPPRRAKALLSRARKAKKSRRGAHQYPAINSRARWRLAQPRRAAGSLSSPGKLDVEHRRAVRWRGLEPAHAPASVRRRTAAGLPSRRCGQVRAGPLPRCARMPTNGQLIAAAARMAALRRSGSRHPPRDRSGTRPRYARNRRGSRSRPARRARDRVRCVASIGSQPSSIGSARPPLTDPMGFRMIASAMAKLRLSCGAYMRPRRTARAIRKTSQPYRVCSKVAQSTVIVNKFLETVRALSFLFTSMTNAIVYVF